MKISLTLHIASLRSKRVSRRKKIDIALFEYPSYHHSVIVASIPLNMEILSRLKIRHGLYRTRDFRHFHRLSFYYYLLTSSLYFNTYRISTTIRILETISPSTVNFIWWYDFSSGLYQYFCQAFASPLVSPPSRYCQLRATVCQSLLLSEISIYHYEIYLLWLK